MLTVATERVRVGDVLLTGPDDQPLRRRVTKAYVGLGHVYLTCADGSVPILPVGRFAKVEREAAAS